MINKREMIFKVSLLSLILLTINFVLASSVEEDFLILINNERTSLEKTNLTLNPLLTEAAYLHAKDMIDNNYFSHTSIDGRSFSTRIKNAGYSEYYALGENIAYHSGNPDSNKVFSMWKGSSGHYGNMISSNFNEMGLGVYYANGYTYYVQDLGGRKITAVIQQINNNSSIQNSTEINQSQGTNNNPFTFDINFTKTTETSRYLYFALAGNANSKSKIQYEILGKTRVICLSCTKFRLSLKISKTSLPEEGLNINFKAQDSKGNIVNKSLILK